jgi:hypothetical protein
MKYLIIFICLILPVLTAADEFTYSNVAPQIQRLQGAILFPVEIEQITVDHGQGAEQHYKYKLLRIRDNGQRVHQDRKKFVDENRGLFYRYAYGDLEKVVEAIESNRVDQLKTEADAKLDKIDEM